MRPDPGIPILHRHEGFVIVDKPTCLLSVPGRGPHNADCVTARVAALIPEATGPMAVHRLDYETSGLMVVALNAPTHRALSILFEQHKTRKRYVAILEGEVEGDEGRVELPIRADWPNRPRQIVDFEHGRPSTTLWRAIGREAGRTRVEFRPLTGRTHQLRVHAATPRERGGLGAPIVGDPLYGTGTQARRMMLHAQTLAFPSPVTGEWLEFRSQSTLDMP
ncbi:MAG: RluA family pseudouridine synthase [Phycisphaerales bacterium]|nr:RluA family pseudouridine synthase [Phycisphaerales bacterium]